MPFNRHLLKKLVLGSPTLLTLVCAATLSFDPAVAVAQDMQSQESVGWQADVDGMRHFSGLRCPDEVGAFFRTKVLASDGDRMAACIYTGNDGMSAVLRQHLAGTGQATATSFLENYKNAGFQRVTLSGPASEGISFKTRPWTASVLCETLWYFDGPKADYTLWMAYGLPSQEAEVGPALDAFVRLLNRQI
ncbi:hypothetical protein [Roseibium limicola]|uniref:hypothetical protein n=1 Tax=Roseibium limicola TaxID=2816037 RepID=UPI001AD91355|nr:hypothetical protein [Roseibium limicola]